jgi:hypothetical protein
MEIIIAIIIIFIYAARFGVVRMMISYKTEELHELADRARILISEDMGNPHQIEKLEQSLKLFNQCNSSIQN